ncbi:MAG: hypothetical protein IJV90_02450, partial [Candidatus Methanomethylophilaceae archaeon]|nr:hypothetical protein [Candidatus Methanomethylophilaceae archaeon]
MINKYTNNNGVKLLAAIAVFAIAFAGIVAFIGIEDSDAQETVGSNVVNVENLSELKGAILNQKDGQVWNIATGTYDFTTDWSVDLKTKTHVKNVTGFIFPVWANDITINCATDVVIRDSTGRSNGDPASQTVIYITGNNVTIDGMKIQDAGDEDAGGVNKAINVLGDNFILKNSVIGTEAESAGSILYEGADAKTSTIRNVTINDATVKAWRANNISLTIDTVTINVGAFGYTPGTFGTNSTVSKLTLNLGNGTFEAWFNNEPEGDNNDSWVFETYTFPENTTVNINGDVVCHVPVTIPSTTTVVLADSKKVTVEDDNSKTEPFAGELNGIIGIGKGSQIILKNGGQFTGTINAPENNTLTGSFAADSSDNIGVTITGGSLTIGGTIVASSGEYSGVNVVVSGNNISISGTLSDGVEMTISEGTTVTVSGAFINNGTIINNGTLDVDATITNDGEIVSNGAIVFPDDNNVNPVKINGGSVAVQPGQDVSQITGNITSVTSKNESFGMSKDLESDYTVKTSAFLENNLTIPEGITLTISGKLDLNGKELTVKGTLVVENNGYITSIGDGKIAIGPKGTIVNDGIIGKDQAVFVHLIGDEENMVSVEDAIGLGFGQIKKVSGDKVSYKLSISGDVKKKADAQPTITIIGNVTVVDTLSIGNGVTLTVNDDATLTVSKNALLEITSKGQINGN